MAYHQSDFSPLLKVNLEILNLMCSVTVEVVHRPRTLKRPERQTESEISAEYRGSLLQDTKYGQALEKCETAAKKIRKLEEI